MKERTVITLKSDADITIESIDGENIISIKSDDVEKMELLMVKLVGHGAKLEEY